MEIDDSSLQLPHCNSMNPLFEPKCRSKSLVNINRTQKSSEQDLNGNGEINAIDVLQFTLRRGSLQHEGVSIFSFIMLEYKICL